MKVSEKNPIPEPTKKLYVKDVENAICGLDIHDKYGDFTDAGAKLSKIAAFFASGRKMSTGESFTDIFNGLFFHDMIEMNKNTKVIVLDKDGNYYEPGVVAQVELELAMNSLIWEMWEVTNSKEIFDMINKQCKKEFLKTRDEVIECYHKIVALNEKCCLNNEDFCHFHFKMTD